VQRPCVATHSDIRLKANVDVETPCIRRFSSYMEPNAQLHSPTALSLQNNRESVPLLSDQRRRRSMYVCMYICIYIRYSQTPINRTPHFASMNMWLQKFPNYRNFDSLFTHNIAPKIATNEEWRYFGVEINCTDQNKVSDNKIIKPNNKQRSITFN
jgi:hypothetical protein